MEGGAQSLFHAAALGQGNPGGPGQARKKEEAVEVCALYCATSCAALSTASLTKLCLTTSFDDEHKTQTLAFRRPSA